MEDSGLPLNPHGEDKDTDETECEQGKHHPKGSMSSMGGVQEPHIGSWLSG